MRDAFVACCQKVLSGCCCVLVLLGWKCWQLVQWAHAAGASWGYMERVTPNNEAEWERWRSCQRPERPALASSVCFVLILVMYRVVFGFTRLPGPPGRHSLQGCVYDANQHRPRGCSEWFARFARTRPPGCLGCEMALSASK